MFMIRRIIRSLDIFQGGGGMAGKKTPQGLTPKQEAFAQAIASGMEQSAAYRAAYTATKMNDKTIHETASRLRKDSKVTARIKELKRQNENTAIWTRQDALEMLLRTATDAETAVREPILDENKKLIGYRYNAGAGNVIVKAVEAAAKMCGYNEPDKVDTKFEIVMGDDAEDFAN